MACPRFATPGRKTVPAWNTATGSCRGRTCFLFRRVLLYGKQNYFSIEKVPPAQRYQGHGKPWGDAGTKARRRLEGKRGTGSAYGKDINGQVALCNIIGIPVCGVAGLLQHRDGGFPVLQQGQYLLVDLVVPGQKGKAVPLLGG